MAVTLHVALDPRDPAPADVAIVVDCIRATTTISHALDTGYASVTCVGEIDDAHAERAEGVLLGGERHGVMIEGFDLGNSPAEYAVQRGERIVLTTTNGTRALRACHGAREILASSFFRRGVCSLFRYWVSSDFISSD